MWRPRPLSILAALILTFSPAAPAARASATTCSQVTLTLVLDRFIDLGAVTGYWGSFSGPLTHPITQTAPPFIYRGDIAVPQASYTASWSYRIAVGSDVVFDSGPSLSAVALGQDGQPCAATLTIVHAAGDLTVRAFRDPNGRGSDPSYFFGFPLDPGVANVPVHICLLPLTGVSCVVGSESALRSPRFTSVDDPTAGWGSLLGRYRVWADPPQGYFSTYPTVTSTATDCGAPLNVCDPGPRYWIVNARAGGSLSLDVGEIGPALETGALGIGFWRSRGGQRIIASAGSAAATCDAATWLRGYAPFQDLGPAATCAQVATYVSGVIKSANASGGNMNAMLKAQMLATALDVYFSDETLGGNLIRAPRPLRSTLIDVTAICTDAPTCTAFGSASSAFGGADLATVIALLDQAASSSNAGGSAWYGNAKATQAIAMDLFTAVNEQCAFGP